ncbi:MAG: hypothetical protein SFW07_01255 [Gammaproteobacteria bacterium]|nr:hypothetical protein [Gammaproteobacteria bacterium]
MKFELVSTQDLSTGLSNIQNDRKKKDELKPLGFTFNVDNEKNYSLESFPFEDFRIFSHTDDKIHITISHNGTMVATKEKNSPFNDDEKRKIDAVVKKMYELLDIKENEYQSVKQTGLGVGSANAASAPLPPTKNYHSHLAAHIDALNTALKPHLYRVNTANNTLEKIDSEGKLTGHKITVNEDGSTKGDLHSDLTDADVIAKNIADDHIAVVNMHLALFKQGIKPDKKINLFLIKENLSAEDKAKLPAIETKIKELLATELKKPEYDDIRDFIVYEGVPLKEKAETPPKPDKSEPPREKDFLQKILDKEDTGNMWLRIHEPLEIAKFVLIKELKGHRTVPKFLSELILKDVADNSEKFPPTSQRPIYFCTSLIPYHHFVLIYLDKYNKLHYIDSMSGNDAKKTEVKEKLKAKFPQFDEPNIIFRGEQNDGWSCGYRVAREILIAEGLNDHPLVKATTSQDIRNAFIETAKAYISRLPVTNSRLFEKPERYDNTEDGKMQYYEISETHNKLFFDAVAGLDKTNLNKTITDLAESNPKFRHALLETAPYYIYFNNGKDNQLGVGENGMGQNNMGIALMEARNELFLAKDKNHALIVKPHELRNQALEERGEVDNLVGAEETKGKSILEIMKLVRKVNNAKAEADATKSPRLGR